MERFTVSLPQELAQAFDQWIAERGYANRSEAFRDLLRAELERKRQDEGRSKHCVACLSYVYDHHERDLAERLTTMQHDHHDLTVSSMHAHLDHDHCIETLILRGPTLAVRRFADAVSAERGVRHGQLNLISVTAQRRSHRHGAAHAAEHPHPHPHPRQHQHLRPAE